MRDDVKGWKLGKAHSEKGIYAQGSKKKGEISDIQNLWRIWRDDGRENKTGGLLYNGRESKHQEKEGNILQRKSPLEQTGNFRLMEGISITPVPS
jgi:hypothetical protein